MPTIKLQSSDGKIFETDVQIAKCSGMIKEILQNYDVDGEGEAVLPLPKVNSDILRRVLQWTNHYSFVYNNDLVHSDKDEDKEMRPTDETWDANFLSVDQGKNNEKHHAIFFRSKDCSLSNAHCSRVSMTFQQNLFVNRFVLICLQLHCSSSSWPQTIWTSKIFLMRHAKRSPG